MKRTQTNELTTLPTKANKVISAISTPFVIGLSGLLLSGCSDQSVDTFVANSVEDCTTNTGLDFEQCNLAYQDAMEEAQRSAPQFFTEQDCEYEFGIGNCFEDEDRNSFFPLMAGYLIADKLFDRKKKKYKGYYTPVFAYKKPGSRYFNNYMFANGQNLGSMSKSSYRMNPSTLQQKPKFGKTVSRGGFGQVARQKEALARQRAKSSSRSRSWGG